MLFLVAGLQTDQLSYGLVEVYNSTLLIHYKHTILDSVEKGLKKAALACQSLDNILEPFRIQSADTAQHFVEEIGFDCWHWLK